MNNFSEDHEASDVRVSVSEREYSLASWSEKLFTRLETGRERMKQADPNVRDVIFLNDDVSSFIPYWSQISHVNQEKRNEWLFL